MNEIWCVVAFDSDGDITEPVFFQTKEQAGQYIVDESDKRYKEIEDLPDTNCEGDCETDLYCQVWTDETSWIWRGFCVTDPLNKMIKEENKNV